MGPPHEKGIRVTTRNSDGITWPVGKLTFPLVSMILRPLAGRSGHLRAV